ncbi:MAG: hypothetical protein ACJ73E_17540 [Mycobacteriales bacterium]
MRSDDVEVTALAINVAIPETLQWTDARRGETFTLTTLNVRLRADGHLAAKAYGRPSGGGRGTYVSFAVPNRPELGRAGHDSVRLSGSVRRSCRG